MPNPIWSSTLSGDYTFTGSPTFQQGFSINSAPCAGTFNGTITNFGNSSVTLTTTWTNSFGFQYLTSQTGAKLLFMDFTISGSVSNGNPQSWTAALPSYLFASVGGGLLPLANTVVTNQLQVTFACTGNGQFISVAFTDNTVGNTVNIPSQSYYIVVAIP